MVSGRAYVRDGRITRNHPVIPRFSSYRLGFVAFMLSILVALIFANPVNKVHAWLPRTLQSDVTYRQPSTAWLQSSKVTNYGVFALEKTYTSIRVIGFSTSEEFCFIIDTDPLDRESCAFVGKSRRTQNLNDVLHRTIIVN